MALWRRRRGRRNRAICLGLALLMLASLPMVVFFRFRPVLTDFAESQALWIATRVANRAIEQTLLDKAEECDGVVAVTYAEGNRVSALMPDTQAINRVRTAVTDAAMTAMEQQQSLTVSIPLGTLLGAEWLSGWGPLIQFPISCTATVLSAVTTDIEAVAINQSKFTLDIRLDVQLLIVTPGGRSSVATQVSYPMVETVLLGEVPDNLTEVYGDDQTLLGQIFDYGTSE